MKGELFETLCPGLTNNPSDTLDRVAQEVTDSLGNVTHLTIHAYFINIFTAIQCMTGNLDKNICIFVVDSFCKEIRDYLELT